MLKKYGNVTKTDMSSKLKYYQRGLARYGHQIVATSLLFSDICLFFSSNGLLVRLNLGAPALNLGAPALNLGAPTQNFGASLPLNKVTL